MHSPLTKYILPFLFLLPSCSSDDGNQENPELMRRLLGMYDPGPSKLFKNEEMTINAFDLNNDGTADMWKILRPTQKHIDSKSTSQLARKEVDSNFDGHVDVWLIYNDSEQLKEQLSDTDFDTKIDQRDFFEKGQVVQREIYGDGYIIDGNTAPKAKKHYKNGNLYKIEHDTNADLKPDRWEIFLDGRLTQVGYDKDNDGRVDYWDDFSQANRQ